jgi:hypothetical protein
MNIDDVAQWSLTKVEDEVAILAARIAAATGRFLHLLAELDRREAWGGQGFVSLAHWLSWRTGLGLPAARDHVRVARALGGLPKTAASLERGEISYSKARAITRVGRPETEEHLLVMAKDATAAQLDRIVAGVQRADPAKEREQAGAVEMKRTFDAWFDDDGMLVIHGRLAAEEGALLMRALDSARRELWLKECPDTVSPGQQRADSLALVADRSLTAGGLGRTGAERTMVMIHVDKEVLTDPSLDGRSQLDDGPNVPAGASRRLACDASLVEVVAAGNDVKAGRRTRVISTALRRALRVRDQGTCRFPGCTHRIVDAHHVQHWIDGGPTTLANLTCLCRSHHVLVHEGGFRVEVDDSGARFFRPDGRMVPLAPAQPRVATRLCDDQAALSLGRSTLAATWDGSRVDYGTAVAALVPQ